MKNLSELKEFLKGVDCEDGIKLLEELETKVSKESAEISLFIEAQSMDFVRRRAALTSKMVDLKAELNEVKTENSRFFILGMEHCLSKLETHIENLSNEAIQNLIEKSKIGGENNLVVFFKDELRKAFSTIPFTPSLPKK